MNASIISLDSISAIVLFIVMCGCLVENLEKNKRSHVFMLLCLIGIIGSISDMMPFILIGHPGGGKIALFFQAIALVCGDWFVMGFVFYLKATIENAGRKQPAWVTAVATVFGTITGIIIIVGCHCGIFYEIRDEVIYRKYPYSLVIAFILVLCIYCVAIITVNFRILGTHDGLALYSYIFFPVIAAAFETKDKELSISFTGLAMATLVLYIFIQTGEIRSSRMDAQAAEMVAKEKSDFIARFSHELRTPINAVIGMDEIIMRTTKEEETLSCARDIKSAGNTLLNIINDILDSARIESGKVEVIEVAYDPINVFNDLHNLISSRAKTKKLDFFMEIDPQIPSRLYGDEVKIKQIITNLLTNAVKYTSEGEVKLSVKCEKKNEENVKLRVCVTDTGMGIKEEDIEKLFSPFSRIDELKNRYVEGTGLGMFITQSFLKMLDSQIEVKSTYGKGSSFSFEIIQRVVSWNPIGEYEKAIEKIHSKKYVYSASFTAPDAKLLIVDDNNVNITVCKRLLRDTLVQCDSANSGFAAIELCRNKKYDLIFMDQMMPEMDGIETKNRIREDEDSLNKETAMIALTANAGAGTKESLLELGFDDYLSKPIEFKHMEAVISSFLPDELLLQNNSSVEI